MLEEVRSLQRQVIRQERLAAVGQLVSGVAHEINNPLQAILGFSELLQMQANVPDDVKRDLMLIQKESARARGIIRNLALFTRQQTGNAERVRLTDVISSVLVLRQRPLVAEDGEVRLYETSVTCSPCWSSFSRSSSTSSPTRCRRLWRQAAPRAASRSGRATRAIA